ncbi:MAG TPA: hypothetical protein PLO41_00430 [Rubrivivax sp.]|nr:hypothetical protein [Rubrivivax sp.]
MSISNWSLLAAFGYGIWVLVGIFWLRRRKLRVIEKIDNKRMTNDDIVKHYGKSDPEVKNLVRDGRIFVGAGVALGIILYIIK